MAWLNITRLFGLVAILSSLAACQADRVTRAHVVLFDLPLLNINKKDGPTRPAIEASIDGRKMTMLVDTGTSTHIRFLSSKDYAATVVAPIPEGRENTATNPVFLNFSQSQLNIGGFHKNLEKHDSLGIVPPSYLDALDGIISPQTIDPSATTIIDFPRKRVIALKANLSDTEAWYQHHFGPADFTRVVSPPRSDHLWLIEAQLKGARAVKMLLDTGAFVTHMRSDYIKTVGGDGNAPILSETIGDLWGNIYNAAALNNQSITIDGKDFLLPKVVIDGPVVKLDKDVQGIIAMDVLENTVLIVPWHDRGEFLIAWQADQ